MKCSTAGFALLLSILLTVPASALDSALSAAANQTFLVTNAKKDGVVSRPSACNTGPGQGVRQAADAGRPGAGLLQRQPDQRTVFDGTSPGLPASLAVGNVIPGLAEALSLMHEATAGRS